MTHQDWYLTIPAQLSTGHKISYYKTNILHFTYNINGSFVLPKTFTDCPDLSTFTRFQQRLHRGFQWCFHRGFRSLQVLVHSRLLSVARCADGISVLQSTEDHPTSDTKNVSRLSFVLLLMELDPARTHEMTKTCWGFSTVFIYMNKLE